MNITKITEKTTDLVIGRCTGIDGFLLKSACFLNIIKINKFTQKVIKDCKRSKVEKEETKVHPPLPQKKKKNPIKKSSILPSLMLDTQHFNLSFASTFSK